MHVNLLRTEVSTGDSFLHLQVEKPESSPGLTRNVFLTWYVRTDWLLSLSGIFFFSIEVLFLCREVEFESQEDADGSYQRQLSLTEKK